MRYFRILFTLFMFVGSVQVNAQRKSAVKPPAFAKFKAPKLFTALGDLKDSVISLAAAEKAIAQPLKITDAKGVVYSISSYHFLYRKIVATEDEATGRISNTTTIKSSLFKTSPLPDLWINMITENLKRGEAFLFFDVIVKDNLGRVMYAPDLKITLK
jgi:hypothetical protein